MRKRTKLLAIVMVIGAAVLLAACTGAGSSVAIGSGAVKIGPAMFQLPSAKPADVKPTPVEKPATDNVKVIPVSSEVSPAIVPADRALASEKATEQVKATGQGESWAGHACSLGGY